MSMKCRTTAGSLPPLAAGEEKQISYAALVLQPLVTVFADSGAASGAATTGSATAAGAASTPRGAALAGPAGLLDAQAVVAATRTRATSAGVPSRERMSHRVSSVVTGR